MFSEDELEQVAEIIEERLQPFSNRLQAIIREELQSAGLLPVREERVEVDPMEEMIPF